MAIANTKQARLDFWINWSRLYRMNTRKWEFITEVVLSLLVVSLAIYGNVGFEIAMIVIGVIHSLNMARMIEAYQEAKVDKKYKQTELE